MELKVGLDLRVSQKLVLTTQMKQYLELVQLPRLELVQRLRKELEENPLLETENGLGLSLNEVSLEDTKAGEDELGEIYENLFDLPLPPRSSPSGEVPAREISVEKGLRSYLVDQLYMSGLSDDEIGMGKMIIGNIDDDGILRVPLSEIFSEEEMEKANRVLEVIQNFDPPGVGGRSISEVFRIQARAMGFPLEVRNLIEELSGLLDKGDIRGFLRKVEEAGGEEIFKWVLKLDPKPGRNFSKSNVEYAVPDVEVFEESGKLSVRLVREDVPSLRISRFYVELLKKGVDSETEGFIKKKMKAAMDFIEAVKRRNNTLIRVAQSIVKFQEGFLRGTKSLLPLSLKDIAGDTGFHESTVSRAISRKFMLTPKGLFSMRFFFSGSVEGPEGGRISTKAVKDIIAELIEREDKRNPLSDSQIQKLLMERGIKVARRTVAKYRESLGIPSRDIRKIKG